MRVLVLALMCVVLSVDLKAEESVSFKTVQNGVKILVGDQQVAEFVHTEKPAGRPFISNVKTLDGVQVTRNYPVKAGDQADHPHHQGIFHTFSQPTW